MVLFMIIVSLKNIVFVNVIEYLFSFIACILRL